MNPEVIITAAVFEHMSVNRYLLVQGNTQYQGSSQIHMTKV